MKDICLGIIVVVIFFCFMVVCEIHKEAQKTNATLLRIEKLLEK